MNRRECLKLVAAGMTGAALAPLDLLTEPPFRIERILPVAYTPDDLVLASHGYVRVEYMTLAEYKRHFGDGPFVEWAWKIDCDAFDHVYGDLCRRHAPVRMEYSPAVAEVQTQGPLRGIVATWNTK